VSERVSERVSAWATANSAILDKKDKKIEVDTFKNSEKKNRSLHRKTSFRLKLPKMATGGSAWPKNPVLLISWVLGELPSFFDRWVKKRVFGQNPETSIFFSEFGHPKNFGRKLLFFYSEFWNFYFFFRIRTKIVFGRKLLFFFRIFETSIFFPNSQKCQLLFFFSFRELVTGWLNKIVTNFGISRKFD